MNYYKLKDECFHSKFGELPEIVTILERNDGKIKIFAQTDISTCKYWLTEEDFNKYYELVNTCIDCEDK